MAVIYLIFIIIVCLFGDGSCKRHHVPKMTRNHQDLHSMKYETKSHREIVIPIMIHLDKAMTNHLQNGSRKINFKPKNILKQVEKVFAAKSLNQRVRLKLLNMRVVGNSTGVVREENVSEYLKSYCDWQRQVKTQRNETYFSALLTGLDIYYINAKGQKVLKSTGRGYMSMMCSLDKSCAVIKWHPKDIVHLLAHEIAHSLGVNHDGVRNSCRRIGYIMAAKYNRWWPPQYWSPCSAASLKAFMSNERKSSCLRP